MALDRALQQYRRGFILIDTLAIVAGFFLAHGIRHGSFFRLPPAYAVALPYSVLVFLLAFRSLGVYERYTGGLREALNLFFGVSAGMAGVLVLPFFYRGFSYSRLTALLFAALTLLLSLHFRHLYRAFLDISLGRSQWLKRVLVIGQSGLATSLLRELTEHKSDYVPVSIDGDSSPKRGTLPEVVLANPAAIMEKSAPDLVVVADPDLDEEAQRRIIDACLDRNIHWKVVPHVPAPPDQDVALSVVAGVALLGSKGNNITGFNYVLKRVVDIGASVLLLLLFSPLLLAVAIAIKAFSRGPVFFAQERIGYRGRPFKFYKFRSMHVSNDESIHQDFAKKWIEGDEKAEFKDSGIKVYKITEDPRIIPWVGAFIRKFSIDELPQLFNVIKGDMSLVGPRPCLPYEAEMYRRWHKMRFDALPGITGLWQVSGRNRLSFDQMVALDIRYLQNWSLGLDLQIMVKTPYIILFDKAY